MWHGNRDDVPLALQSAVERSVDESRVVGVCLGISLGGRRYFYSAGNRSAQRNEPMPLGTRFELSCLAKVLGSAAILELCHQGAIGLHTPIGAYLPPLTHDPKGESITVAHLLSHTAGYLAIDTSQSFSGTNQKESLYASISRAPQLFEPGSVFSYQNSGAVLLSDIAQHVSGRTTTELIRETFIERLRQRNTAATSNSEQDAVYDAVGHAWSREHGRFVRYKRRFEIDELWQPAVCSDIAVSVSELLSFSELLLGTGNDVTAGSGPQLSPATTAAMGSPVVTIPRGSDAGGSGLVPTGYGYGLGRYFRGLLGHDGTIDGQSIGIRMAPAEGCAFVVGMNCGEAGERKKIYDALSDALSIVETRASQETEFRHELSDLEGTYVGREQLRVNVRRRGEQLMLSLGNGDSTLVEMVGCVDGTGYFMPKTRAPTPTGLRDRMCYTFFADPCSGTSCLMMGVTALKKLA